MNDQRTKIYHLATVFPDRNCSTSTPCNVTPARTVLFASAS